jgi:hypothetical protein
MCLHLLRLLKQFYYYRSKKCASHEYLRHNFSSIVSTPFIANQTNVSRAHTHPNNLYIHSHSILAGLTGTSQIWTSASCSLQLLWCNLISDEKGARHPGVSTKYLCTVPTVRTYTDDISRSSGSDVFVYNVTSWKPFGLHNKRSSRRTQRRRRSDNISVKWTK